MSGSKSLRSKLDDFFSPGPSSSKKSHVGFQKDIEDPVDIYNHTKQFFKKGEGDSYADQIEVGVKKIKGDIDLDNLIYGGQKVSRKELQQNDQEDDNDSEMDEDEEEEEQSDDEDENMNGEEDDENDDDQDIEIESNDDDQEFDDGEEEDDSEEQGDDDEIEDGKAGNQDLSQDEDDDLDAALQKLKEEEKDESSFYQTRISSEIEKAKSVKVQKKVFDQFLHQRILMQKLINGANKLPQHKDLNKFINKSKPIKHGIIQCKRNLKKYVKDITKLQKELFKLSETNVKVQEFEDGKDDTEGLDVAYNILDSNFTNLLPFAEEAIDRWNSRTQIIKNINQQQQNKHNNKALNKTILEQVNSLLNDEDNKVKLVEKTQLKRDQYKVYGRSAEDLTKEKDENIYNDFDFYQNLLKDYLANNDGQITNNGINNDEDDIYVDGADLNLTQKFLEKRRKLQENGKAKVKKEVDRKASKNRKIRYVVHDKIVNFMTGLDNLALADGKDSILQSLFGQKVVYEEKPIQGSDKKSKKSNIKQANNDFGDIRLI